MYTINPYQLQKAYELSFSTGWDRDREAALAALNLYQRAKSRSRLGRVWCRLRTTLTGQPNGLLDLNLVLEACSVRGRTYAGLRTVSLNQVCGSEGRSTDFDLEFVPLCPEDRRRWIGIAVARLTGVALPPVSLIQVRDTYFVRDGHHRISVARAMGQEVVDAEVVVWQVVGTLPWEQTNLFERFLGQAVQESARSV